MKKIIILFFLLLCGCSPTEKQIKNYIPFEYTLEEISLNLENNIETNLEDRLVYKNKLHMIEIITDTQEQTLTSNRLFTYDITSESLMEITQIKKGKEDNRIWDFIQLGENHFIYIETENIDNYGDMGEQIFYVYDQQDTEKELVTSGKAFGLMNTPDFSVVNDKVYLLFSLPIDDSADTSYTTELWEFTDHRTTELYKTENGKSESIRYRYAYDSDGISFVIRNANEYQKITINEDEIERNTFWKIEEDQEAQIIPLTHSILVSFYSEGNESNNYEDIIKNYLVSDNGTQLLGQSYDFLNVINVGDKSFLISDNNNGLYAIYEDDENVYIDIIENISQPIFFRSINDHELLVKEYDYNDTSNWVLIKMQ